MKIYHKDSFYLIKETCCIYKLVFSDKRYYIGQTADLRKRLSFHKTLIISADKRAFYTVLGDAELLWVEVLYIELDYRTRRRKEFELINSLKNDPLLLNFQKREEPKNDMMVRIFNQKMSKSAGFIR